MATIARLVVDVSGNVTSLAKDLDRAGKRIERFASKVEGIGRSLTIGFTLPLAAAGASLFKLAADAQESEDLFSLAMGEQADAAREFSERLRKELGLNAFEVRRNIATFQAMFTAMGLGRTAALEMSQGLAQLSADLASTFNLRPEEAFQKLQSAIAGEVEPLRRLGVLVDENTVKQAAWKAGIAAQGAELTQQQKTVARYIAIVEQTALAQGNLALTLDSPVNRLRRLKATLEENAIALGTTLLPAFIKFLEFANRIADGIRSITEWFQRLTVEQRSAIVTTLALVAAVGPLLIVVAKLAKAWAALPKLLALVTSPAGAVIVILASLAFAATVFIKNWEVVRLRWLMVWTEIQDIALRAVSGLLGLIAKLSILPGAVGALGHAAGRLRSEVEALRDRALARMVPALEAAEQGIVASGSAAAQAAPKVEDYKLEIDKLLASLGDLGTEGANKVTKLFEEFAKQTRMREDLFTLFGGDALQNATARMNDLQQQAERLLGEGISPQSAAIKALVLEYEQLADKVKRATDAQERMRTLQQAAAQVQRDLLTPVQLYAQQINLLTTLLGEGLLSAEEFRMALVKLRDEYVESTNKAFNLGETLQATLGQAFESVADTLGMLVAGIATGMRGLGKAILGVIGNIAQQVGKAMIAFGIAGLKIRAFVANPFAAIAAGAALVALGSALASTATRIAETQGGGVGAAAAAPGGFTPTTGIGAGQGGTIIVQMPGGSVFNPNDPRQVDEFAQMMRDITGRRVIVETFG